MKQFKTLYPHLLCILGFIFVSVGYFYPTLQGKKIYQSDIVQYTGMAKEQNDFRKEHQTEPYWTTSAFGGMPTYQLGAHYPYNYIKKLDTALRFLPRPADYLFLYFIGFYILLLVVKIKPLQAFIGALSFGFSTYLIIILGVGHNAKAHAIAYMPMVLAGVLLVFRKRYHMGALLTMIAGALEINANHFQMTYYLLLLLLVVIGYFAFYYCKKRDYTPLWYAPVIFVVTGILAIAVNATNLLATAEYAQESTRHSSELSFDTDGGPKDFDQAMSYDYITEYSYGIAESLNLIAPRLFGGSNHEDLGRNSNLYEWVSARTTTQEAEHFIKNSPTYWGNQPIVAAPAYIGAVLFFLFILALFAEKRKLKYIFIIGSIFSLILSWGKNINLITQFFVDFFPLYNKFRAVSSIQIILELCVPALAMMGLQRFLSLNKKEQRQALWKTILCCFGLIVFLFFIKGLFNFAGPHDTYYMEAYGPDFINALQLDRKQLYNSDLMRSSLFIFMASAILWLFTERKIMETTALILLGLVIIGDLVLIDKNYVNTQNFVKAIKMDKPFEPTVADLEILKDTSHYRVFEVNGSLSSARSSYFHKSIGGYHAAKPRRIQQLFDYQIYKGNMEPLHMLNVKYIIQTDKNGRAFFSPNLEANGNAWFVKGIDLVNSSDEEMKALDTLDSKHLAIVNEKEFGYLMNTPHFTVDSTAKIILKSYTSNHLEYKSFNTHEGLGVFSEIFYSKGWNAYIDGQQVPHFRVNYVLRGLQIPAGTHRIVFQFEPTVIHTGSRIALMGHIGMLLVILGSIYFTWKKRIKFSK